MDDLLNGLLDKMYALIHEIVFGIMKSSYEGLFDNVNGQIGLISGEVVQTPAGYSYDINHMIQTVANDVILPIGVMIITALFCYELINGVLEKNAMHEMGTEFIFKWLGKACIGVLLLSYTFDMTEAIFELGSEVSIAATSSILGTNPNIDTSALDSLIDDYGDWVDGANGCDTDGEPQIDEYNHGVGELFSMAIEAFFCKIVLMGVYVILKVLLTARMIEIYMMLSVSPIPFATFINRDWSNIGTGYVKKLVGLAFQALFIVIALGIYYTTLTGINNKINAAGSTYDLHGATLEFVFICIALVMGIFASKSLADSIFSGH